MNIKILVLSSNPQDTTRLRLDKEIREIEEGLQRSKKREQLILEKRWAVRLRDLRRAMLDHEPDIVHFCGHGDRRGLVVEDENGNTKVVSPDALANLFELFQNQVNCVVLNSCYSQLQANGINRNIDYVIGMQNGIRDEAAIEFAVGFYDALGAGKSVEEAFKFGYNAIQLFHLADQMQPVLNKKLTFSGKDINYEPMLDSLLLEKSSDLFFKLQKIREVIVPELRKIPNSLYSLDAEGHVRQVLRLMSELYHPAFEVYFNSEELFIIGVFCLIHDIGMTPRNNTIDSYHLYRNHCQYSYDYVISLAEQNILDRDFANKIAELCLIHNKPVGRAKTHLAPIETPNLRLFLIFLMFRIADMLEIEQHPGEIHRMSPDIVTSTIGEFDIDSSKQTITLVPPPDADPRYFELWSQVLKSRFEESQKEFNSVGVNYKVVTKEGV